ncbi:MAG: C40 family peptidase [Burkholderiales bacterium]|nr:C40 family peptidase [Burkholderiales bacterium]
MSGSSLVSPLHPRSERRQWLAALAVGVLFAGCASRRPTPVARGGASSGGAVERRVPPAVPPTQAPLMLDPAGREASVAQAMLLVNTPYRYGGNTPEGGFDCSGLVHYVFGQVAAGAARLPRSTAQWAAATVPVDEAALQRGDLVFFNTSGAAFSHMGIYVGGGQFVHAPSSGGTVRKDRLDSRYFGPRYLGGRRVFAA